MIVVQEPSSGFKAFVNYINCDVSHVYMGRYWFSTPITDAIMKCYKIMNYEIVTYTVMKKLCNGKLGIDFH